MKNIYLAGKLHTGEGHISELSEELEHRGHTVIEKWFLEDTLPKPYLDNPHTSGPAAEAMVRAAYQSDVFILHPTDTILGAAVEFGAALASTETRDDKKVIIVNPFEVRQSVFYAHPAVLAIHGLAELRSQHWY